ncbi:MAG: sugar phosphate isomerase/epimerase [Ignavibacteria bacterium]|nr:sugar phosphate isomerase/epimerase [Ignavibacteria bacterium]
MKFSIVLSTHAAQFQAVALKGSFEENIAKISGWGYDGVELAIRDPLQIDAKALARTVSSYALSVPAIGTGQAWGEDKLSFTSNIPSVRRDAVERIRNHIDLAAHLGSMIILGLIRGKTSEGQMQEQSMTYLIEALRECTSAASARGVRFALEPINRYETDLIHTVGEGLDLIEKVGADNLGLLLDTFHMNIEEPNIEKAIRQCGDRLFHFHVADSNRWYPGAGHLDFRSIMGVLEKIGYDGFVSGEFMPLPSADLSAERAIAHLRAMLSKNIC